MCRSDKRNVNDGPVNDIPTSIAPTTARSISTPNGTCSANQSAQACTINVTLRGQITA